jgi:hypothetical protein
MFVEGPKAARAGACVRTPDSGVSERHGGSRGRAVVGGGERGRTPPTGPCAYAHSSVVLRALRVVDVVAIRAGGRQVAVVGQMACTRARAGALPVQTSRRDVA